MNHTLKRPAESAGELFLRPTFDVGDAPSTNSGPAAARRPAISDRSSPTFSRRSVVATMIAAFAPAAATAVALPTIVKSAAAIAAPTAPTPTMPAAVESPELLTLGAELELKLQAYRAAAAQLTQARALAQDLWPSVPPELVVIERVDREFYFGCYEPETDLEGNEVWPEPYEVNGRSFSYPPREILRCGCLELFLADVRAEPDGLEAWVENRLIDRIAIADRYEAACDHAREASDIEQAKREAERTADDLCDIAWSVRDHLPRTIAGVMIHARALAGYADAEHDGFMKAPGQAATILGRGLADAVLRVAGTSV